MRRVVGREIQYARSGGVAIAYQVVGEGDTDLVYVPDYMSNLVYGWEYPRWRDFYLQLSSRFRLILFDKRGTGLSDHGGQFATLETRMEDLHAVLDAAGSARTVILASHEGCGMAALYAATYPERTAALALFHPRAWAMGSKTQIESPRSLISAIAGEPMRCPTRSCARGVRACFQARRSGAGSRTTSV
jgi:pimeloyl-ACP methyl ester carboxylesterase